jgi:hypothetical protein
MRDHFHGLAKGVSPTVKAYRRLALGASTDERSVQ